ncbi:MAG: helix-turn-helix transcriptional regulator [Ruminococcus sp.]|nr:helix-turn-helix transcriptional regulator [Ruminococcus sp.]
MNVHCIGWNSVHGSGYSIRRNPSENGYMLILMKSSAFFNFDGTEERADKDTVVVYDTKMIQEYRADDSVFIYDWIMFDADDDGEFFDSLEIPVNMLIRYTDAEFISGIIRNIANEFYSVSAKRTKMIDSLMKTLLIKVSETNLLRGSVQQNVDPHYGDLVELREKIYRNPQMKWTVDTMAASVNMSRSYFQHIYRELFGVSCISDVISGKIEKAKELLSETSCTVSQVAAMCGYDNEEHFMRQFKKIVGVTPTAYRKKS